MCLLNNVRTLFTFVWVSSPFGPALQLEIQPVTLLVVEHHTKQREISYDSDKLPHRCEKLHSTVKRQCVMRLEQQSPMNTDWLCVLEVSVELIYWCKNQYIGSNVYASSETSWVGHTFISDISQELILMTWLQLVAPMHEAKQSH